ncbi:MAG TPA: hypothetical protein VLT88_08135, partial [Desulfosarcina sp.]|nr:hypothetical protein [Desulfosarcina sp.]
MNVVSAVTPGKEPDHRDPAVIQAELQRYSDEFIGRTVAALDEYARVRGTPEAERFVLNTKLAVATACVAIATGPNPTANLVDFLAMAITSRMALEDESIQRLHGTGTEQWLDTSRVLEEDAWSLASGFLTPAQQDELRAGIQQWWSTNAGLRSTFFERPQRFSSIIQSSSGEKTPPGSVFGLVGLDPTAG